MRIGLVNPYSYDVPGGVQLHVRDLAEHLIAAGHDVSVLTPAEEDTPLPPYAVSAGRAVPVRYNGSVARLAFGPVTNRRVERWLAEGAFDVVHIHEPMAPSTSVLALWATEAPVVATFHSSMEKARMVRGFTPMLRPAIDKITGRIAVSQDARRTVQRVLGLDAVVIPNGVYVERFQDPPPWPFGDVSQGPTVAFLGRFEEPRKGLPVLLEAMPRILAAVPDATLLIAGPGEIADVAKTLPDAVARSVRFLGMVSHADKVALLAGADVYVAPNTGGESFGIILAEALAAGSSVVASDLAAFTAVLGDPPAGEVFPVGDHEALAAAVVRLLGDPARREELRTRGRQRAWAFDWSTVGAQIEAVYDTVRQIVPAPDPVGAARLLPSNWPVRRR